MATKKLSEMDKRILNEQASYHLLSKKDQIKFLEGRMLDYPCHHTELIYIKLQINRLKLNEVLNGKRK